MKENVVFAKSKEFAVRIVNLYRYLQEDKKEYVMSKQLLRSGTSIGANIAESECAISEKDFLSKLYIAFKECAETMYWLELLHSTQYIIYDEYNSLIKDCDELKRMLSSITKTMSENLEKD
jgi:four helix bundle protein